MMIINGYEIAAGADLRGADLLRADLREADLHGADLQRREQALELRVLCFRLSHFHCVLSPE